jgi:4-diphosphocytidyl-2-C-methyl-D-erythritol kinase
VRSITLPAFAKVNLDLRILGNRPDGYHDLRTIFQTVAINDTLTFIERRGRFAIECDDPSIPTDQRNLVWKAAAMLWRTAGLRRGETPRDALVQLKKRIPAEAGLGGGSANAAVTLIALAHIWNLQVDLPTLSRLAASLGADVPYFLVGGTALGLGRGDDIYPLTDLPRSALVVVRPRFGVSTVEAYGWYDSEKRAQRREPARKGVPLGWPAWTANLRNDLEGPVTGHHPTIGRIKQALVDAGAVYAAMSGSGSTVFGLFERHDAATRTARDLARPGWQVMATRTLNRSEYARRMKITGRQGRRGRRTKAVSL